MAKRTVKVPAKPRVDQHEKTALETRKRAAGGTDPSPAELVKLYDSDTRRFAEASSAETLTAAAGYWSCYPLNAEVIWAHQRWTEQEKHDIRNALDCAHRAAVELLMRAAHDKGLDPAPLDEAGRVCREIFWGRKPWDACDGDRGGRLGIWPECLGRKRYKLPQGQQDAIRDGQAVFVTLGLEIGTPSEPLENASPTPGGGDGLPRLTCMQLATKYSVDSKRLRKRLDRWRRNNDGGYREVSNRRPREPQFLYDEAAVQPVLAAMMSKASGQRTGSEK